MKKLLFILTISLFLPSALFAQINPEGVKTFAKSYDYVNDFEKILTSAQLKGLNDFLKAGEAKTKSKVLIIITPTIAPYTDLTDYSADLDKYLVSQLKIDTSILIILSKQLRQIQVQGVDKLRFKMSDQQMKDIVSTYMLPELKKGDYYKALEVGTIELMKKLE
jgi:uncharacterized protein